MFLEDLQLIGLIWVNSVIFLIIGHVITVKAYRDDSGLFKKKLGIAKKVTKAPDDISRSVDAVVPEWGKE